MRPALVPPLLACVACQAAVPLDATGTQLVETFRSDIVDDDYLLRIRLPPGVSREDAADYPLVIQLDPTAFGARQFEFTVGYVSQAAADGVGPEAVVVGVDYPDDPFLRERDYRPPEPLDPAFAGDGADRFYRVLRDELLPHLLATLPIDGATRVLVGHSNGGVFGWYTAFRHEDGVDPLFTGVVAADAGIDSSLFTLERWHAERATDLPIRLFATRAFYNGAGQAVTFDGLIERLEGRQFPGLALQTAQLKTDHGGAVALSYEPGLAFVLGGAE